MGIPQLIPKIYIHTFLSDEFMILKGYMYEHTQTYIYIYIHI